MLKLVPLSTPSPQERVRRRIRQASCPDGLLQCNRCGSRTATTIVNGAFVKNGRVAGGTVIGNLVCDDCRKQGIVVSMLPELWVVK